MYNYNYNFTSAYNDGGDYSHGSPENARLHRKQMEEIANSIVSQAISDFANKLQDIIYDAQMKAYKQAINNFTEVMHYDIESCVTIGFKGCGDIFYDSKTQKFISDRIVQELKNKLNNLRFDLEF